MYLNMIGGVRHFVPQHGDFNTRGVPVTSNEILHQQRTTSSSLSRGLWTHSEAGLDSPDV